MTAADSVVDPEGLLDADDLAAIFKVGRRRVMEWQSQHSWPCVRVGRTIRWTPEQVEQIKARHTVVKKADKAEIRPADGRTARSARRSA